MQDTQKNDTARRAMEEILRHFGIPAEDLAARCPEDDALDEKALARAARHYGLRATALRVPAHALREIPVPALVQLKDGRYALLAVCLDAVVILVDAAAGTSTAVPAQQFAQMYAGFAMTFSARQSWAHFKKTYHIDWFFEVVCHYRRFLAEVLVGAFFLQLMGIGMPLLTQVIVDKVIGNEGYSTLKVLTCSMALFCLVQAVLSGLKAYLLADVAQKLDAILGSRLFRHLASLPLPYFENRRAGDILMRVEALSSIREFLTGDGLVTVLDTLFSVVFVAVMLSYSVPLTLIALAIVPLYLLENLWAVPRIQQKLDAVWRTGSARESFLVESVAQEATVKALALEPQFRHQWEKHVAENIAASYDHATFRVALGGFSNLIETLASLGILWYGGHMVMDGVMTLGQLIAFQMIAGQAMQPMTRLLTLWPTVQQTGLALERMGDILNAPREPVVFSGIRELVHLSGGLAVRDVDFRYRADLPLTLQGVSFDVRPGEWLGLIGPSGSGKSTIAQVLQQLSLPEKGGVLYDGRTAEDVGLLALRRQIGVVSQDTFLFDGSVRENIAFVHPEAGMDEVIRAAQMADAHDFILELPEGYDTRVGSGGMALSGGQRQRIALARAVMTRPPILLLDEATSALDYASERQVMDHLERFGWGQTMIIIAHRLSTVAHCHRLLVLRDGRIAASGTPGDILPQLEALQKGTEA